MNPVLSFPTVAVSRGIGAMARRARRRQGDGVAAQELQFRKLVKGQASSADGRSFGIQNNDTYDTWSRRLPLRTYEGFVPLVERMLKGEADVLCPGVCNHFAVSSGTTAGRTKYLPVNDAMIAHFRRTGLSSLLMASDRCGAELFAGRHLFLGGATSLEKLSRKEGVPEGWAGDLSGITAMRMPLWAERMLYEPGREIAAMSDWPAKIEAIARRTLDRDLRLIAGIPSWILVLAEALKKEARKSGRTLQQLRQLWPQLRCLVHGGVPIGPYVEELRQALGAEVGFHEVYPASEGFIAAQDGCAEAGLRLFVDAGIFYEFVPVSAWNEADPAASTPSAVTLEGVQRGRDYVLVMTTPAGLSRYVIGDIVRIVDTDEPRLIYAGRTKLQLSAFGEHVIERELTEALTEVAAQRGLGLTDFHVAPVFVDHKLGVQRGCHEWWLATETTLGPEESEALAQGIDAALARRNDDYAAKRQGGGLSSPSLRIVRPDIFNEWKRRSGKWGGQNKMPRCRSDRQVAEQLASVADEGH